MGRVHVASAFLFAAFVFAAPATAQQGTAQISGKVTDAQGAVLPGVSVVVRNEETGATRELTSSVRRHLLGGAAHAGPLRGHRPSSRASGRWSAAGLVLLVGTTLTIDLALPVGGIEENVTVTGQSPLVDTTSATVGGNVGTAELSELPAMNRNYFSAVALLPGVQFSPSNQMGNDTIVANGQTRRTTTSRSTAATTPTTRSARARARRCGRRSKRCRNSRSSPACTTRSSAAPAARSSTR